MRGNGSSDGAAIDMQLAFAITNTADGTPRQNVIFIGDNASDNKVQLNIQLSSGTTMLQPGTIPDPLSPPTSGTTIYLDLSSLGMSSTVWAGLTASAKDWTFKTFPAENVLGMTPTTAVDLSSGASGAIIIAIDGIKVPQPLATPQVQLYADYYNVPGVTGMYGAFAVALLPSPAGKEDLSQAIAASVSVGHIVNSPTATLTASNAFSLQMAGIGGVQPQAGPNTVFVVGFVYGKTKDPYGFGALTDVTDALNITIAAGTNAGQWAVTFNQSAQSPSWTLQPPPGAPIVGTGVQSVVAFDIANVVTPYQPGPTAMIVSYSDVPGYKDGAFVVVLNKVAHARIKTLQVSPNPAYFSGGSAAVTVNWTASDAQGLALTQAYQTTTVTGKTQVPATLNAASTVFTLTATGLPGAAENVDRMSVLAQALPVINSFTGTPTEIFSGSQSHDALFAWAVDSPGGVTLSATGGAFSGQTFGALGNTTQSITQPQMVTLTPTTDTDTVGLTRRLVISAFTPTPKTYPLAGAIAAAVSPTGPFVLAAIGSNLVVLDTVQYSQMSTVAVGHPVTAIAFSIDGGLVATANADQTVSIFSASVGPTGLPVFGAPATVAVGGVPEALVFSANGPRLFVSLAGASAGQKGQVVSLLSSGGSWGQEASVTVGLQPRGLCLDAAGSRLFVANSGDDTVSAIGLTKDGALGGATIIQGLTGGPTGVAAAPTGQQLLVSCATVGTVVSLDPNHPNTGQRQTLTVGGSPGAMAVTPNGSYAFVANDGDGTLSLIDCWGLPSRASVLGKAIPVGSGLSGVAVSPDGLQVVAVVGGGLSVVTLATYQPMIPAAGIANHPTSVAALVDGSAVYAWHDASVPAAGKNPGILVYSLTAATLTNLLADKPVLRCVCSSNPLAKTAFVIVQGEPTLYVVDTDSLDVVPVGLSLDPGAVPVALAVSGDADRVWVVAETPARALSLVALCNNGGGPTWTQVATVPLYSAASAGRFLLRATPDGSTLFLVDVAAAKVRIIQHSGKSYVLSPTVIAGDVSALDAAVLPDGSAVYVLNAGSQTNTITVIDVATLASRVVAIPQTYVNLTGLQPSPDGRRLFATDTNAAALRMLDPASLRILQTIPLATQPSTVAGPSGLTVAADGSRVFTANTVGQSIGMVEQIQMGLSHGLAEREYRAATSLLLLPAKATAGSYSGLYMRHDIYDTPASPTTGWSASPDVFPYGPNIEPNPSDKFGSTAGYGQDWGTDVSTGPHSANYVYVRGLNTTAAPITSRAYFYYTTNNLALWPANWVCDQVTVNNVVQNWVDVSAQANAVGVAQTPLLWSAPNLPAGADHYCVVGWVDNSANPQPPDLTSFGSFATFDDLIQFIIGHHNMAWRNTHEVLAPPPDYFYNTGISMQSGGGSVMLTITFPNVPLDGTFAVNVQGTDARNSVSLPQSPLTNYQGGFSPRQGTLVFPANFQTSVQVWHWPGATPLPPNAKIKVSIGVQTGPAMMRDIQRSYRPLGLRTPLQSWFGVPIFVVGSTTFNLKFGAQRLKPSLEIGR